MIDWPYHHIDQPNAPILFPNDKATNIWRGTLYEAILHEVKRGDPNQHYSAMFLANVDQVTGPTAALVAR